MRGGVVGGVMLVGALVAVGWAAEPPYQGLARRLVGADQGVYVRTQDGTVLAAVAADRAVHPASVSKIPTTLALLRRLGPTHRFETRIAGTGPIERGVLAGDLVVEAASDPFLITEHALWIVGALRDLGVRDVEGRLGVRGRFFFNWRPDPQGTALRAVLTGAAGREAWSAARAVRTGLPAEPARIVFRDRALSGGAPTVLLRHKSPPLVRILKAFNCYSNNVFHPLAEVIGGAEVVERMAREALSPPARAGLVLENGAGAGTTNRVSPRAAVELTDALAAELGRHGLELSAVLPVAGVDVGTLRDRLDDVTTRGAIVGKTGTYGDVGASALAGTIETRRWGRITFAILNRGVAVPEARARQDAFVQAVVADAGARPLAYQPDPVSTMAASELAVGR